MRQMEGWRGGEKGTSWMPTSPPSLPSLQRGESMKPMAEWRGNNEVTVHIVEEEKNEK